MRGNGGSTTPLPPILDDSANHCHLLVLVDRGESVANRKQRLTFSLGLSPREYEVARLVAGGHRGTEIAATLHIATGTLNRIARTNAASRKA